MREINTKIIFISYSHDSEEHRDQVLALSERLRKDGLETRLDRYINGKPKEDWPRWMLNKLDEADYVLIICTETYYRRFRGHEAPNIGKGVDWEGALITQEIYDSRSTTCKFVPVLFEVNQQAFIPEPLRGKTHYVVNCEENYQALYDAILEQAGVEPSLLGQIKRKARKMGRALTFTKTPKVESFYFNPNGIKGLRAFEFDDFEIFQKLQRNDMLQRCITAITSSDFKFGVLYAESGCGKTSFLQAGLHHVLNEHPRHCAVYIKFSNEEPITTVMNALKKQAGVDNLPLNELYTAVLTYHSKSTLVLIFDQFEQFFLHHPQAEQRQAFIAAFAEWYQYGPIKILISIRSDYMHGIVQLEQAVNYTPNWQEKFELKKFTPIQATEIFRVLAESNGLPFEKDFITEICNHELAKQDGTISPVDIQILSWLVVGFQGEEHKGFTRKLFLQKGGIEGLLENFVTLSIQALSGKNQQDLAIKVLVALIDKEKTLRAGLLNAAEITERVAHATRPEVTAMLERLADSKIRLITAIETDTDDGLTERKYEIAHEKLIKGVLNLARKSLQGYDQANLLLDKRVSEWLGNNKGFSYLLSWKEYRLINKNQAYLVWGDRQADKRALLAASKRQFRGYAIASSVLLVGVTSGGLWWQFCPQAQIMECKYYLSEYSDIVSDENKTKAVNEWLGINNEWPRTLGYGNEKSNVLNLEEVEHIENLIVKKIYNEKYKAYAFQALAQAATTLGDRDRGLTYLSQAKTAAENIKDETPKVPGPDKMPKAYIFQALAQTAATLSDKDNSLLYYLEKAITALENSEDNYHKIYILHSLAQAVTKIGDKNQGLSYLKQLQTVAKNIKAEEAKASTFQALAKAAITLGDENLGLSYLGQAQTAAENIKDDRNKTFVFQALAEVTATIGDKKRGLSYLKQLQTVAENIKREEDKVSVFQALAKAAVTLGDKNQGLTYLERSKTMAEKIDDEYTKITIFQDLAETTALLGDKKQGFSYLKQLQTVAENLKEEKYKVSVFQALALSTATLGNEENALRLLNLATISARKNNAIDGDVYNTTRDIQNIAKTYAKLGSYRNACQLAKSLSDKGEALQILAAALREYGQQHYKKNETLATSPPT